MAIYNYDKTTYSQVNNVPGFSYTRSGTAYQQNASGVWTSFDENVPPINAGVGLGVWEARTNYHAYPASPTNWSSSKILNGITATRIATGTEYGFPYADYSFVGTSTGVYIDLDIGGYSRTTAGNADTFTASMGAKMIGGSTAGLIGTGIVHNVIEETGSNVFYGGTGVSLPADGTYARKAVTRSMSSGAATTARAVTTLNFNSGAAINCTWRFYGPQFEKGASETPFIPGISGSPTTRGAPSAYLNAPGLLVPPFTVQVWAQLPSLDGVARALVQLDDGTNTNRIFLQRSSGNAASMGTAGGSGGVPTAFSGKTGARLLKMAARVRSTELALACDGAAPNSASGVTLPPNLSRVLLGGNASAQFYPNGDITRLQIINRDVTDAELQALTTA